MPFHTGIVFADSSNCVSGCRILSWFASCLEERVLQVQSPLLALLTILALVQCRVLPDMPQTRMSPRIPALRLLERSNPVGVFGAKCEMLGLVRGNLRKSHASSFIRSRDRKTHGYF